MGPGHPERPERLDAIEERLLRSGLGQLLQRREAGPAALADIELAHDSGHVKALHSLSETLRLGISRGGPSYAQVDPDTALNASTWDAVLCGAGAVLAATDAVIAGDLHNAFCAVRPPGHHACHDRAMGFCFSTMWRLRPSMRWSAMACSGWRLSILMCTTAMAPKTLWRATREF